MFGQEITNLNHLHPFYRKENENFRQKETVFSKDLNSKSVIINQSDRENRDTSFYIREKNNKKDENHQLSFLQIEKRPFGAKKYEIWDGVIVNDNPQNVINYVDDIFQNLKAKEREIKVNLQSILSQIDINEKMRAILIDWLVDVHSKFKLTTETLFMSINILDRYLDKTQVTRNNLQLVGIVCLFLASKFEDIYPPDLKECLFVTENSYSRDSFIQIEGEIIKSIEFNIKMPTPLVFLERYKVILNCENRMYFLARYLIELSLLDYKFLKYTASNIACSALYLAGKILRKEYWNKIIEKECQFNEHDIRICSKELCIILQNSPNSYLQSIRKKYAQNEFDGISRIQLERLFNKEN